VYQFTTNYVLSHGTYESQVHAFMQFRRISNMQSDVCRAFSKTISRRTWTVRASDSDVFTMCTVVNAQGL